ncbi:hypothetical protein NL676_035078 [Syzygium grande]|nr:hypothetical protein NL676_035078 [Syzygium grande]
MVSAVTRSPALGHTTAATQRRRGWPHYRRRRRLAVTGRDGKAPPAQPGVRPRPRCCNPGDGVGRPRSLGEADFAGSASPTTAGPTIRALPSRKA